MIQFLISLLNIFILAFSVTTDDFFMSFSYSLSNPKLSSSKKHTIALIFTILQFLGTLLGWILTDAIESLWSQYKIIVPYIALMFFIYIGTKQLLEGLRHKVNTFHITYDYSIRGIILHGLTTSIDSFSIGLTFTEYGYIYVICISLFIGLITYIRSHSGLKLGQKLNAHIPFSAGIVSGIVIILVGIEIFVTHII